MKAQSDQQIHRNGSCRPKGGYSPYKFEFRIRAVPHLLGPHAAPTVSVVSRKIVKRSPPSYHSRLLGLAIRLTPSLCFKRRKNETLSSARFDDPFSVAILHDTRLGRISHLIAFEIKVSQASSVPSWRVLLFVNAGKSKRESRPQRSKGLSSAHACDPSQPSLVFVLTKPIICMHCRAVTLLVEQWYVLLAVLGEQRHRRGKNLFEIQSKL